ncbi:MAG: hypothetical protein QOE64_2482, partial [Frankiales bacterium]|nr:hypothetical protein [Frankiales bacterium]
WAAHQEREYVGAGPERPLGSFGLLMAGYAGFAGAGALLIRRSRPDYSRPRWSDLALLAVATAKLSRLLARDRVTSPLRAPFTQFEDFATADEVEESPRGSGLPGRWGSWSPVPGAWPSGWPRGWWCRRCSRPAPPG